MSAPQLPRYEILNELGQGGMSVVYRARDKQLSRDVALKVLHDFLAKQTDARRRFHREAVAVAKLHHPGILEIFDYSGPGAEQSYIVTELIEGLTLRELIEKNGKPRFPELGALVTAELVRALRHAHEQGVVHRDLKPENIMITTAGQLKLMDFGIAQIMGGATKLTATGTLLGSPAHMAPEVIDGHASDHRSDIFSVGTILYWLTTGVLPFAAPNPSALFRRILEGRYEPAQMVEPKIGNKLSRTIDRALALNPDDRYQDISELEHDLAVELEEVGLEPAETRVKDYLSAPIAFADAFEADLVARLTERGETALAEGHVARAMDRFNRVLAIDPHHDRVKALVARVGRRERLTRGARRAAVFAFGSLAIGGVAYGAVELYPRWVPAPKPNTALLQAGPARTVAPNATVMSVEPEGGAETETEAEAAPPKTPKRIVTNRADRTARLRGEARPRRVVAITPPPPRAAPPSAIPPVVEEVVSAKLRIKILNWAHVRIDDETTPQVSNRMFELAVGEHEVQVIWPGAGPVPPGRFRARRFLVDERGQLFELRGGKKAPAPPILEFVIPRTNDEATRTEGWTWS